MKYIESIRNPLVRRILHLQAKSSERKRQGLFVVEGSREVILLIKGGYVINELLVCSGYEDVLLSITNAINTPYHVVSKAVYQKLAYRSTSEGILAIGHTKPHSLDTLNIPKHQSLLLVLESPEKPGNVGAILRTADASGVDAIIIVDAIMDLYNPNVVRASLGSLFTSQIAMTTRDELVRYLRKQQIRIYATILDPCSLSYDTVDFRSSCAIILGSESNGLTCSWKNLADERIQIPMEGNVDSINLSVSAGILTFEVKRQRR